MVSDTLNVYRIPFGDWRLKDMRSEQSIYERIRGSIMDEGKLPYDFSIIEINEETKITMKKLIDGGHEDK